MSSAFIFISFIICIFGATTVRSCIQHGHCVCVDNYSHHVINLTLLALDTSPRFTIDIPDISGKLWYNPCHSFQLGESNSTEDGSCGQDGGVAVCVESNTDPSHKSWGSQISANIHLARENMYQIKYTDNSRTTILLLNCTKDLLINESSIHLSSHSNTTIHLTLNSPCACNNGCPDESGSNTTTTPEPIPTLAPPPPHSLSVGSILIIIFFVLLGVYLIGGILYRAIFLGARGIEMIPNNEFWVALPFYVKDGFLYMFACCRRTPSYDNI